MFRAILLPFPSYWYVGCLWAVGLAVPAYLIARRKNRTQPGWALLCGLTGFFFGVLGSAWLILLATRAKLSMRMKFLGLKVEEQIADMLKLPSPVGNDLEKRILMVLAYNPQGLRIGALAQGLGQNWRHIQSLVQELESRGKLRKIEDRYFFNLD